MDDHTMFEYSQITPQIFIGTNLCCITHFAEPLLSEGITFDVSLEEERLDMAQGSESFVWIPVKDHTPPTKDQLDFGVTVLAKIVSMGKKAIVHCKNGHGRAPTLVAAYLMSQGTSLDEAISFIRAKRPSIHLEPSQVEALKNFETRV